MAEMASSYPRGLAARVKRAKLPPPSVREQIRIEAGLSLRALADELDVDPMSVHRWEKGFVRPRLEHAIAYRRLLEALQEACA
jgi:DNA-binding XRE family transcriptional regulator